MQVIVPLRILEVFWGVIFGALLSTPMIVGGQIIKIFLDQRDSLAVIKDRTELLVSELLPRGRLASR